MSIGSIRRKRTRRGSAGWRRRSSGSPRENRETGSTNAELALARMMLSQEIMRNLTGVIAVLALVASAACTKPDERLTKAVQDRLASDQIVRAYHLDVNTDQKVVSISGTV